GCEGRAASRNLNGAAEDGVTGRVEDNDGESVIVREARHSEGEGLRPEEDQFLSQLSVRTGRAFHEHFGISAGVPELDSEALAGREVLYFDLDLMLVLFFRELHGAVRFVKDWRIRLDKLHGEPQEGQILWRTLSGAYLGHRSRKDDHTIRVQDLNQD